MKNIDLSDKGHDINLVCKPEHDLTDEDLKNKDVRGQILMHLARRTTKGSF